MARGASARTLLAALTAGLTTLTVVLIAAAVGESQPASAGAVSAVWTVGLFIIAFNTIVAWWLTGLLLRPLHDLRRNLSFSNFRIPPEARGFEVAEVQALRHAIGSAIANLDDVMHDRDAEHQRLIGMFEAISEGIVQLGPDARILHVNAAACALLNLPARAEGQHAASLMRHAELRDLMERAARGESVAPTEVLLDNRQLLVAPKPLFASRGETAGAVMTIVELTELRRLESVRRDFVANVSHELKTPLTSIRGYTETLISDEMSREVQLQFLEVVRKNATRIQRIVDELLDLSRLQSGGWQPDPREVDAREIAFDVWAACSEGAEKRRISFAITGPPAKLIADPGGLRQVLSNLFDNALRYTPDDGQIHVRIRRVRESAALEFVEIEIRDNGIGIPGDALPRIFERFFRVDPARSRNQGGTGLGLSIVKHLVDRMDGDVIAESELGKGTSIKFRLPAARQDD